MGEVLQVSTMRESIWDEHEAIAKAIGAGDEHRAEALIRQHGEDAGSNLARLLTQALQTLQALNTQTTQTRGDTS
jgi:DNA-binding GntR family transcriptional regulator